MELYTIILYSFFCFIGAILPGPTSLLALNLGLNNSIKAVFLASIGAAIADFLIICAIGFGLKQIIGDFPIIFEVIKTLGFFYLIFIAYMIWKSENSISEHKDDTHNIYRLPIKGFLTAISNPKVLVFFIAFLPQFIDPNLNISYQYIVLGIASSMIDIICMTIYGLLGVKLLYFFKDKTNLLYLNRISAICMASIAMFLIIR